jgi:hypothetical protein
VNRTLLHEGKELREFYAELPRPVLVGIEAIGPMQWFLNLLEELGIECRVGDAAKIRAAEPRKQKSSWSAMTEEMLGGQHQNDESDTDLSVRGEHTNANDRCSSADTQRVCPEGANTPEKSSCNGRPR